MRSILYWLTSTLLAVLCMNAAATPNAEISMANADTSLLAAADASLAVTAADPLRAILLGIGIMAMAYTYQRVWANFSEESL